MTTHGQIVIGSVAEAQAAIADRHFDAAVSIADPYGVRPSNLYLVPSVLSLSFDDVTRERADKNCFTADHAARLLSFLGRLRDKDRVLFHCFHGHSRSTAAALVLLYLRRAPHLADALLAIRPKALPNQLVLSRCEAFMGLVDSAPLTKANEEVRSRSTAPLSLLALAEEDEAP